MRKLLIEGEHPLEGKVVISGAKNSAVALIPAALLTDQQVVLENVPDISDVRWMFEIMRQMGASIRWRGMGVLEIKASARTIPIVPHELAKRLRASSLFLGPLLARYGKAKVSFPGGCEIGSRPLDLHMKGLRELGAKIWVEHGYIIAETDGLRGRKSTWTSPASGPRRT